MCGIAGYISLDNSIKPPALIKATSAIRHRGPDAEGFYYSDDGKVGLGHRRLSIIDLSASANQPMFSLDNKYVIIYNGEVYNYQEIRQRLGDKGASLRTSSDTEVLLQSFVEQGVACFKDFNGMFALAIYDIEKKVLTLCRDHAGIKPLFIYCSENEIIFSSELKSIQSVKEKDLKINKNAIPYFLHLGFIPHPQTIFKDVKKFPAAHFLQIDTTQNSFINLSEKVTPFWKVETKIKKDTLNEEKSAKGILNDLLSDAIEKQLISDVPIGTFLSGGVDSSLVTAIASKVSNNKINTFSIAIDDGKYDESKYALQVAENLKTHHHEFRVKEKDVLELINDFLPVYDEPFADSSALPTMMVSRMAKEYVTVALSGDGGDELFMGYGAYKWARTLDKKWISLLREPLYHVSKLMSDRYQRAGNLFSYSDKRNLKTHIFSQEQYFFSEQELDSILVNNKFDVTNENSTSQVNRKLTAWEEQSLWDFNYYLPDDLLVKVDRASMHYSLETRVPLLDYRIIEFSANLSSNLKMKGKEMKYLLKQVLYDYLPKEIFDRPKWGFSIPLKKWLKTDLFFLLEKYTSKSIIDKYNLLHYSEVDKLKKNYLAGKDHLFNRLWAIIVLHWWLEENNVYE
ncbi:MAG: asparagine synthase (glutamine-hydrolyzing) [Ginsengibacter sp.]